MAGGSVRISLTEALRERLEEEARMYGVRPSTLARVRLEVSYEREERRPIVERLDDIIRLLQQILEKVEGH